MAAVAFWVLLLLPTIAALVAGTNISALWSMPAWTLPPIALLSNPTVKFPPANQRRILLIAFAVPVMALIAAPAVAIVVHYAGIKRTAAHGRYLQPRRQRAWRQATPEPLRFGGCNVADEVIAYAQDRPYSVPLHSFRGDIGDQVYADAHDLLRASPAESASNEARLARYGMALVCLADEANWVDAAATRAARNPASRRIDLNIKRDFLGITGRPQHYVIFIIPRQS